jgi:hypothetical protein
MSTTVYFTGWENRISKTDAQLCFGSTAGFEGLILQPAGIPDSATHSASNKDNK